MSPIELRQAIREGRWSGRSTSGEADDHVHANVVVLPKAVAFEFLLFCQRNPSVCALLEVLDAGSPRPRMSAPSADIRTDVPAYRVFRAGELVAEPHDVLDEWRPDAVTFLIGGAISFEGAMRKAGIPLRHRELGLTAPIYVTSRRVVPAGVFAGPLVVSMRPVPAGRIRELIGLTSRYPLAHGAPLHVGAPAALGIDLDAPVYGDPVPIRDDELPAFWACGVTPQWVAKEAKPEWMVTHGPGRPFVTDLRLDDLDVIHDLNGDRANLFG